ncbi:MAG: alpha/beta fold hydrolase [Chitinophagaceae bacterium]
MYLEKEIAISNKKVFYRVIGKGATVVLVHGFGEDGTIWKSQIEALKNKFQLIIPDLPGSGRSEMIENMSMEGLAEVVKNILETEARLTCLSGRQASPTGENKTQVPLVEKAEINNASSTGGVSAADLPLRKSPESFGPLGEVKGAFLIGHSMGGYIALAFIEKYWHMLKGYGLFHSTAYADTEEKVSNRKKGIHFMQSHSAFEFLKTTVPGLYSPATKEKKYELVNEHLNNVQYFTEAPLVAYYQSMIKRPGRTHLLKQIPLPVLFVAGRYDTAVPINDVFSQSHLPDLSYIHILESSGHMGMVEEPEKSNSLLIQYFTSIEKFHLS